MPRSQRKRHAETPQQIARTRQRHIWLLLAISLAVYLSALPGDFVWSDHGDILLGQHRLTSLSDIGDALTLSRNQYRERFDGGAPDLHGGSWQPGVILANTLSWGLWGKCSLCWHIESLLWHLLTVLGLYILGRQLFSQQRHANSMALWSAALFAAHPAGVASVAWIGGRPELLASALGVAGLVLFSRLQPTTNVPRAHTRRWMIGSAACALAAMLMHEIAYLLPLAALLAAGSNASQRGRAFFAGIAPVRWHAIWLLSGALAAVLLYRYLALGGIAFAGDYPASGFFDNLGTGLRHLWRFVEQALLPAEPVVSDVWEISNGWDAGEVAALLGTLLLVGITLAGLALGHPTAFGGAWFLLWILPGVGLFPSAHYHSDQSLYLASWGLLFSIVFAVTRAWRPIGRQLVKGSEAIIFAPVLVVLMVISGFSNARWWDHDRLFESEIASDPHYIEGRIELARSTLGAGRPVDALNHVLTAIESHENKQFTGYWDAATAYRLLGQVQLRMALYDDAQHSLQTAIEARPRSARSWHLLGQAQIETESYADAEASLRKALQIRPDDGALQADLGVALLGQNDTEQGLGLLETALQQPGTSSFRRHSTLALALLEQRRYADARSHLEAALQYRESAKTRAALALASWKLGQQEQAYLHLSTAMQTEDGDQEYVNWVDRQINNAGSSVLSFGR